MLDFGFGTKRHMVEPLAVSHIVYKFRKIKLMARVQYGECIVWWLNPYKQSDDDTRSASLWCQELVRFWFLNFKVFDSTPYR